LNLSSFRPQPSRHQEKIRGHLCTEAPNQTHNPTENSNQNPAVKQVFIKKEEWGRKKGEQDRSVEEEEVVDNTISKYRNVMKS
jgi:hypothetical protein